MFIIKIKAMTTNDEYLLIWNRDKTAWLFDIAVNVHIRKVRVLFGELRR